MLLIGIIGETLVNLGLADEFVELIKLLETFILPWIG